jgi:competence protein ComEA
VTAQAILAWREEHGGFTAVQELLEVDGIGPATLETLAPLVTV